MNHYLITRFNLSRPEGKFLDPSWLKYRSQIFERFTLPTVAKQINGRFRWFVLFHFNSPVELRRNAERWQRACPQFEPLWTCGRDTVDNWEFIGEGNWARSTSGQIVNSRIHRESAGDWIITSRLDSDDAVSVDFIDAIQQAFRGREESINLHNGWKWHQNNCHPLKHANNPFISYAEKCSRQLRTVFWKSHKNMGLQVPCQQVGGPRDG
ncbi:MAG: glycosyltransferase [Planctomycetaceae bacterium]